MKESREWINKLEELYQAYELEVNGKQKNGLLKKV
jgi:hypothetical protein